MLLIIFFLLHVYIVTHFRRKKILWHQVYNKPIFVPKEFLQTHSPERVEWLEWFIAIMRDLKTPYVVQSILATEICSVVFTRSAESNICTLHHSNTKISLKLKKSDALWPLISSAVQQVIHSSTELCIEAHVCSSNCITIRHTCESKPSYL